LAYIGKERAVADISWLSGNIASGGTMTYLFWRSAYLSMCFSSKFQILPNIDSYSSLTYNPARNRVLVCVDWVKARLFGRDVSRE
jgi:NADH:ubiquinone reductase (non-electrogenic)